MKQLIALFMSCLSMLVACTAGPTRPFAIATASPQQGMLTVSPTPASTSQQDSITPTPSTLQAAVLAGNISTLSVDSFSSTSPDGKWTAEAVLATFLGEGRYYNYTLLTVQDNTESFRWTPHEEWSESGLGESFLSTFYWSADGRYLYFHDLGYSHGCPVKFVTYLRRVDLTDGSLTEIPLTGLQLGEITVSPKGDQLLYQVEDGFFMRDLVTGETRIIPVEWAEEQEAGWYAWSPDRNQLAFTIDQNPCIPLEGSEESKSGTSIRLLDLDSGEIQTLTDYDPRGLVVKDWEAPKALEVFSNGEDALLQIDSGTLLPDPAPLASAVLEDYLNSLALGGSGLGYYTYEQAADLYGGSYETLIEVNPELDPNDHAALLRNACEVNGFQCLRLHEVVSSRTLLGTDGSYEIHLTIQLEDPSGVIFFTGLCCGSGDAPPQTEFDFTIRRSANGTFQVLDLPPYVSQEGK
jgi:hypothetical protein